MLRFMLLGHCNRSLGRVSGLHRILKCDVPIGNLRIDHGTAAKVRSNVARR